ncbi:sugar transferase [Mobilicoccus pelagius]|uniref:Putative glycosyltransferase n=1 Tax=Mobilicoccus pelagius NBRC 104925 TaxID=1089455 RepID=H5USF8_9MICO|nr:sugar transferase [Mobilicoccus pelagius]GAB48666.1 putative glycosyltransferase [Mobilicoccus pelagius NBRC 104925]
MAQYVRRLLLADFLLGVLASALAAGARFLFDPPVPMELLSLVLPFAWVLAVSLGDGYEGRFVGQSGPEEYRAVWRGVLYLFAGLSIVSFTGELRLSRAYVLIALVVLATGGFVVRKVMRTALARCRARGSSVQRTLLVGRADSVAALAASMAADSSLGLRPVAACAVDLDGRPLEPEAILAGVPVVGTPREAVSAVDLVGIDTVAVASHPDLAGAALRRLTWALEERGVDLVVSPGLLDVAGPRMSIRPSTDLSLLHVERPAALGRSVLAKAIVDRVVAALLLLVFSPVFLVVALLVKLDDRGPVFYRQERVGVRGELFGMVKFRSMRVGADAMIAALQAESDGDGVLFKMREDPRITRVGMVLRRYSIDELPQLVNVVRGEMSLVGPRPPLPREVLEYESDAIRRLHVRPGMTGLWQVSGRSDLSWEDSLRLDLRYVDNWSLVTDLQILLRTVRAVLGHRGAY